MNVFVSHVWTRDLASVHHTKTTAFINCCHFLALGHQELHESQAREGVQCLLHTVLFARAPSAVRPRDAYCRSLDLTFARCGEPDVDKTVDDVLDAFMRALAPAGTFFISACFSVLSSSTRFAVDSCVPGPELSKATLLLSFFERRVSKSFWGFGSTEEKVVWEQWKIPFLINHSALPAGDDEEAGKM